MTRPPPDQPMPEGPEDPHVGSEDDPPRELDSSGEIVPPVRYDPGQQEATGPPRGGEVHRPRTPPTAMDRLVAVSAPLSVILFFLIGFRTGMWYIAWVVFLVPPVLRAWNRPHH